MNDESKLRIEVNSDKSIGEKKTTSANEFWSLSSFFFFFFLTGNIVETEIPSQSSYLAISHFKSNK